MKDMMLIENMFSVKDRIVLVTGCGGVATANARCFAKNGATVIMASRRMEKVAEVQKLLAGEGAVRVHGGGFAGTALAFVPNDRFESFKEEVETVLGEGSCHPLQIRG